ncbi:MAG: hypothetical protein ACREUX_02100 [Burkholderiales bacterium]
MRIACVAFGRCTPRAKAACVGLALCLATLPGLQAHAQDLPFAPIDENAANLDWLGYKNRLVEALESRNRKVVLGAIDPSVNNGPEQKRGLEEFRRRWDFDDDASPLWGVLRKAVELGGAYVKDAKGGTRFCTPYVAAKWPTSLDPFAFGAIVSADVLVKTEPSSESRTLATLTHEVVKVEDWEVADKTPGFPQKWTRIALKSASGYVPEQQIRSPIEHMACFSAQGGQWRLVSFTAGYLPE